MRFFSFLFIFLFLYQITLACSPGSDVFKPRNYFFINEQTQECIEYKDPPDDSDYQFILRSREVDVLDKTHSLYVLPQGWTVGDNASCSNYKKVELERKVVFMPQNLMNSKILSINFSLLLIPLALAVFAIILRIKKSNNETIISVLLIVFGLSIAFSFLLYDFVWNKLNYCRFTSLYSWSELKFLNDFPVISLLSVLAYISFFAGLLLYAFKSRGNYKK